MAGIGRNLVARAGPGEGPLSTQRRHAAYNPARTALGQLAVPWARGTHAGEALLGVPQTTSRKRYSEGPAVGDAVADGKHLDLLDPHRGAEFDNVAPMRLHQRSGYR